MENTKINKLKDIRDGLLKKVELTKEITDVKNEILGLRIKRITIPINKIRSGLSAITTNAPNLKSVFMTRRLDTMDAQNVIDKADDKPQENDMFVFDSGFPAMPDLDMGLDF